MLIIPSGIPSSTGYTIENAVWFDGSSDYLSATASGVWGTPTDQTRGAIAFWYKRAGNPTVENDYFIFGSGVDTSNSMNLEFNPEGGKFSIWHETSNSMDMAHTGSGMQRDTSAWGHFAYIWNTNEGAEADRDTFFHNGVALTQSYTLNPSSALDIHICADQDKKIGNRQIGSSLPYPGYLADFIMIDGNTPAITDFGEFNDEGIWIPVSPSGLTFGTNGCWLDFAIAPGTGNGAGTDVSGNDNHWSETSMTAAQQVLDSPTDSADDDIGNYCTLNPVNLHASATIASGNLENNTDGSFNSFHGGGTIYVTSGKWYYEYTLDEAPQGGQLIGFGTGQPVTSGNGYAGSDSSWYAIFLNDGQKLQVLDGGNYSNASYGSAYADGGVVNVALDMDNGKIWFGEDGTWNASGDPAAGTNAAYTNVNTDQALTPTFGDWGQATQGTFNFGQTAFAHTPPTGFKRLNTANLPAPAITDPSAHFQATLYTGNGTAIGSGGKAITQDGTSTFEPGIVWIKNRDAADFHMLFDSVRGATKYIEPDATDGETTNTESLSTFNSNGFTVGNQNECNTNTEDYVAWQWYLDGTSGSTNSDGTEDTVVAVNLTAGISAGTYTGTNAIDTFGHGLDKAPEFIWTYSRSQTTASDTVYHHKMASDPETDYLSMSSNAVPTDSVYAWNDTAPTSTVFTLNAHGDWNASGETYGFICAHSVEGFSKFGSYEGNGDADGPFIYTGFRPSFLVVKNIDATGNWWCVDAIRSTYNQIDDVLFLDSTSKEEAYAGVDFTANGFKLRSSSTSLNGSNTFVYATFAEKPFGGSGVAQARAR